MRRHVKRKYTKINEDYSKQKKSKFKKWIYRALFLILLILLFMQFHHYDQVIEGLARFNSEQANIINAMDLKIHNLELSNANLQVQADMIKVKLNGIELSQLHNQVQNITPHIQDIHNEVHTNSKVSISNIINPTTMITTAAVTIFTMLKGITSLVPTF